MANLSNKNFRINEIEQKANFSSVIRASNFDSKFYLNDKDTPPEDTFDYSGLADPTKFYRNCTPATVMYRMSVIYEGNWNSQAVWSDCTATMSVLPIGSQTQSNGQPQVSVLAMIGTLTRPLSLTVALSQPHRDQSIGFYIPTTAYDLWSPLYPIPTTNGGGISKFSNPTDGCRGFSNNSTSIPGYMKPMQKSGTFNWTAPSNPIRGLDPLYDVANASNSNSGWSIRAQQQRPRVPDDSLYYWTLINMLNWNFFYAVPLSAAQPASGIFSVTVA